MHSYHVALIKHSLGPTTNVSLALAHYMMAEHAQHSATLFLNSNFRITCVLLGGKFQGPHVFGSPRR